MRERQKNVPFRLSEDQHAEFKSYCAQNKMSMQTFLEEVVSVAVEKNLSPQAIIDAIKKVEQK